MADNNEQITDDLYIEEENVKDNKKSPIRKARKRGLKRKTIKNIGIFLLVIGLFFAALYFYNKNIQAKNKDPKSSTLIDEDSYNGSTIMRVDLNQINKINIDLKTADLRIQKSTTNPYIEYTHLYRGEEDIYTVDVSYENGVLNLKSDIKGKELNMKNKIQIVRVFLPADKPLDEIKANIGAGDVKITDLEVKDLDLNVKSGHISFDNSLFGGSVSNEIGDISLTNSELLNTKLSTAVGDINIEDTKIGFRSDFSTQSGDILIKSDQTLDNFNVKAVLEVGNFILGNVSYRNIKDGFSKDNKAKQDINLSTRVGDIIFNKGEGAILDQEEYITNKSNNEEESKYDYINVKDEDEELEDTQTNEIEQTDYDNQQNSTDQLEEENTREEENN